MSINTKTMTLPAIVIFIMTIVMIILGQNHSNRARPEGPSCRNNCDGLFTMLENSSILQINFKIIRWRSNGPPDTTSIKITGASAGAFLEYSHHQHYPFVNRCNWAIELDEKEWRDLIISLYQIGRLRGGGRDGYSSSSRSLNLSYRFKITTKDGNILMFPPIEFPHPTYSGRRDDEMKQLIEKIRAKELELHSTEYEKRFGTPIPSHFQRSMCEITLNSGRGSVIRASLTNSVDSILTSFSVRGGGAAARWEALSSINDWLDIIHLFNINYDEHRHRWRRREITDRERYGTGSAICLPTFDALNETMAGMIAKIKKDNGIDVFEMMLEEEYKKKFGVQISDFERSLISVTFNARARRNDRYVEVRRHANGAGMTIKSSCNFNLTVNAMSQIPRCRNYVAELDIGEWLDFVHALHKIRINQWRKSEEKNEDMTALVYFLDDPLDRMRFERCGAREPERSIWSIELIFFDNQPLRYSGNNTYPPNWNELSDLMSNLGAKISREGSN